nr:MAG TPA: hypothetical protein [Bacteriophage sp.]
MYGRKARKKWVFARFYFKSGQAETVAAQGFAGSLPTFPLFSLSKREKNNIKLYISDEKKWVFGQRMSEQISLPIFPGVCYTEFATQSYILFW